MERITVDGIQLEVEITGNGEPVLLVHGAFIVEAYAPLCTEPALARYSLVRYHRRGYAGSSPVRAPFSIVAGGGAYPHRGAAVNGRTDPVRRPADR